MQITKAQGIAPVKPSHAKTKHDALPLPGGGKLGDASNADLARALISADVPGVSHANGREANAGAYAEHIERIREAGANRAVADWLATKAGE